MKKIPTSPSKNKNPKPEQLTFSQAIEEVLLGKKIHKLEWVNKEYYGLLQNGLLKIHRPDGSYYDWIISEADMLGFDYITLED